MNKRRLMEIAFFLGVMGLSFYTVFRGQNLWQIWEEIRKLSLWGLCAAIFSALFFVSAEGMMIFYLLRSLGGTSSLFRCISYSFIGFFYSGITPSATGGQPMQLYYMKKDGNSLADSSVVLMVVALIYKFVLVVWGILMLIFWHQSLRLYLQEYFGLYLLGLALNVILVVLLSGIMLAPSGMKRIIWKAEELFIRIKLWKPSAERREKVNSFVDSYRSTVQYLLAHKKKVCFVILLTFLQRFSVFFLTYIIYRGFSLKGTDAATIVLLQASVYIAVDMLPIPGAQGITELMYRHVFLGIFTETCLMPSLYVTRGINFYFLMLVSLMTAAGEMLFGRSRKEKGNCSAISGNSRIH